VASSSDSDSRNKPQRDEELSKKQEKRDIGLKKDFKTMGKSRLSGLVAMSTMFGFLAAGSPVHWTGLASAVIGTGLSSACANTLNQIIESRHDSKMDRTKNRPLPTGRVTKPQALAFATVTGVSGLSLLWVGTNPLTFALGLTNIVMYAGIYTPLKQRTWTNTYVGAVVGAIPPVMGWTAATGQIFSPEPLFLFVYQYLWQIPHFLALAYKYRIDYDKGGYQMLASASIDPSGRRCALHSLVSTTMLLPLPFVMSYSGITSWMFVIDSSLVNLWLLNYSWQFYQQRDEESATSLFKVSLLSLALFLACFVFHKQTKSLKSPARQIGSQMCPHEVLSGHCPVSQTNSSSLQNTPLSSLNNLAK